MSKQDETLRLIYAMTQGNYGLLRDGFIRTLHEIRSLLETKVAA